MSLNRVITITEQVTNEEFDNILRVQLSLNSISSETIIRVGLMVREIERVHNITGMDMEETADKMIKLIQKELESKPGIEATVTKHDDARFGLCIRVRVNIRLAQAPLDPMDIPGPDNPVDFQPAR